MNNDKPEPSAQDKMRTAFEHTTNAPLKRHAIYIDQYYDSRAQELWSLFQAGTQWQATSQACQHRIADAHNPVIKDGYLCVDCGALFGAAVKGEPKAAPSGLHAAILDLRLPKPVTCDPRTDLFTTGQMLDLRQAAAELVANAAPVQTAVAVPDGWFLVPKEPDEAMTKAGFKYARALNWGQLIETWQAMCLAAHPQEPKP